MTASALQTEPPPAAGVAATALMAASGFAGLGLQIVWTQQCAVWLGHESAAVLAVVTAFFGGLAVGAAALGTRVERSQRPERWYAGCEAAVAAWGLALLWLMAPVSGWLLAFTGAQPAPAWQWAVAFGGTFLLLLPATAAMGATLPAMARVVPRLQAPGTAQRDGSTIAGLYAANTLGAVAGVLATAFWLIAAIGLAATAGVCIALDTLCALTAVVVLAPRDRAPAPAPQADGAPAAAQRGGAVLLLALLAATGLLGIGDEVLVVRVLSQITENTVYTFAVLLAVYLVGSAAGAAVYQRWWLRRGGGTAAAAVRDGLVRDQLLCLLAAACVASTAALWFVDALKVALTGALAGALAGALQPATQSGAAVAAAIAVEAALAVAAFALPTLVMGALFSHLADGAAAAGIGFGRALAANTLGAAAAPLVFGVLLLPALGPKAALLLVAAGYLALRSPRSWVAPAAWVPPVVALALALWAPPLDFVDVPDGGRVVSHADGAMAAVSVVEDAAGVKRLYINNRQQEGSSATLLVDGRQALLPLLLHPAPRRALFLGLGTGVTASTAALQPGLQVDAVELLPEVIDASRQFTPAITVGTAAGVAAAGRLHVVAADARRFVRASAATYDVIVSDNFHPARSGSAALYTVEHFAAVRQRLAPGGIFCQWLPLHQLDLQTLRSIVRSFSTVYPGGWALLASNSLQTPVIGLVGNGDGGRFAGDRIRARLAAARQPLQLAAFGIDDEYALLGSFIAGPHALAAFADGAAANTDDHPVVAYSAPRITYAADSLPGDRLVALLQSLSLSPAELLADGPAGDATLAPRLAAYWRARDAYLDAGRAVPPAGDVREMLARVQGPLLSALRTSPDFRPAYDPLLRMATALARSDADAARSLLTQLQTLQPARPEAAAALTALNGAAR